ncbi:MAG: hypothetical protein ACK4SN_01175 [Bellilinea sp.]
MAKTRAKVRNIRGMQQAVTKLFKSTIQREAFLMRIRDFAVERIRAETRKGNDLSRGNQLPGKIKPVSPGWQSFKRKVESGQVKMSPSKSEFLRSRVSNLSLTGQLLNSLKGKPLARQGAVEVFPTGKRQETTFQSKSRGAKPYTLGESISTNEELAEDLKRRGWTFLGMDKKTTLLW